MSDVVWAADRDAVQGLERRVVVVLAGSQSGPGSVRGPSGAGVNYFSRVQAISRATTQAVLVLPH